MWSLWFGGLLVTAMVAASFIPVALGVLSPFITEDLGLSRSQLGGMQAAIFLVAAVLSPVAGRFADRLAGRAALATLFLVSGLSYLLTGLVPSYIWLLAALMVAGTSQALSNPATNQLLAADLPIRQRGYVIGVKQSGVQLGAFLAGVLLPTGALLWGWRAVLHLSIAIPLLGLLAIPWVLPRPVRSRSPGVEAQRGRLPLVTWLSAYAFLMGVASAAIVTFLPLYAVQSLAFTPSTAGAVAALVGLTGTVARVLLGGLVDRIDDVRRPLFLIGVASSLSVALLGLSSHSWAGLLWVAGVGLGVSVMSWNSVAASALIRHVPLGQTGRASGVMQSAFYGGFIVSPVVFGWLVDVTGNYTWGWAFVFTSVSAAACIPLREWS